MMTEQFFRDRGGYLWELIQPGPNGEWEQGALVKDIPTAEAPGTITISEGVRELVLFDPDGPVQIGTQMIAPSRDYYLAQKASHEARKQSALTDRTDAQAEVDRIDAMETAAITVDDLKLLNAPEGPPDPDTGETLTPYEKRSRSRQAVIRHNGTINQADAGIADVDEVIAAVDSLGRDFIPIPEVKAEVDRLRP